MEKLTLLYFLLGVIGPGGGTIVLVGLPNSSRILENLTSGTSIFTFSATSTSTIPSQYPLIINTNPLTKAFKIVYTPPTYNVVLTGTPQLDYETNPNSFDLQIYVMDSAGATDLQILTVQLVDVNEPPVFLDNMANQAVVVYITEGSPIGIIYQIKASDPDNANNTLMYRLIPNNTAFMVSISGSVSSTKIFDYETDPHSYTMTVSVLDPNGLSVNGTLTVIITNINDETTYFIGVSAVYTIPEEQIPGTPVANVTALDPDADGFFNTLLYSINTPTPYFTINQINGGIQIAMTIDREADPFRLHPTITLEIGVRDSPSGGHANKTLLTFYIQDLNDNPPMCRQYAFSTSVPETEVNGSLIIDLTGYCSDIDVESPNNLFNFTGLSGLGSNQRFQLIPGSGEIVLIGNLNFEDPNNLAVGNEFTLTVQVQDIAAPYYTKNLYIYVKTIPVDEFPPVFNSSSYVFNVSELSPPGTRIGQLYATDKDYPFIAITYSIVAGGSTLGNTNIFWIDPSTGSLQLINNADYETTPIYQFTVQAENQGKFTSTVSVTVYIIEANDEKPICLPNSYSLSVPSNEVVGTNILNFKLLCTDRDSGPNSFRYFINSGNINNHFAFSPDAGSNVTSLVLAIPFDYSGGSDTTFIYNLRVYITDDNLLSASQRSIGVVQTGTVSITIHVYIPGLTTIKTTTTPRIIYMTTRVNTYSASAWYLPFVITLGCLLLLGLLGFLIYLLAKYCSCRTSPKPGTEPLISPPEKTKVKHDVFWEMTKINTVFDGEAQDPITGKIYEYNTRSGARRWKDTQQPIESPHTVPTVPHVAFVPSEPMPKSQDKSRRVSPRGTPVKREKTPANPPKEEDTKDVKPVTPNRLQTPPKEEPRNETNSNWSPLSPRLSPKVSPKIPKTPK